MQLKNSYRNHPILVSLLLMVLLSVLIFVGIMYALDVYTRHNSSIVMPEMRGQNLTEAERMLTDLDLHYELIDSVYDATLPPGVVVEMVPKSGNTVKPGRIIFLTINARASRKGIIPDLKDMSSRQALAVLRGLGFEKIKERYIAGDFVNLTDGVELLDGSNLAPGTRLPINSTLVLRVINGYSSFTTDSLLSEGDDTFGSLVDSISEEAESGEDNSEAWW